MAKELQSALLRKQADQTRRFLRLQEVKKLVGMSRSWIYDAIRRGDFPAPVRVSVRAVAWDSVSIAEWQERRLQPDQRLA